MGHNERVLGCVLVVLVAGIVRSWEFVERLARNPFTPAIPRAVEPRYPLVEDAVLASDITVVVGTKDTITPTVTQLRHLADALPQVVRVLYTFPQPLWEDADEYAAKLKEAAGLLGERVRLVPVGSFCNPFEAWLQAVPLVRTKYTLLMHNDVFLLDTRGHFLSELYGALEAHPEHTVAAPQIYETELRGLLTTHLFNTNLHLRLNAAGVAFMSHEVDLAMGLSREPADFAEKVNPNFLEDHVFLVRTAAVDGRLIDPQAAFTLEYVDLQLNMLRQNLTQLYVPSARAEFLLSATARTMLLGGLNEGERARWLECIFARLHLHKASGVNEFGRMMKGTPDGGVEGGQYPAAGRDAGRHAAAEFRACVVQARVDHHDGPAGADLGRGSGRRLRDQCQRRCVVREHHLVLEDLDDRRVGQQRLQRRARAQAQHHHRQVRVGAAQFGAAR
jgi:hypothetical protein